MLQTFKKMKHEKGEGEEGKERKLILPWKTVLFVKAFKQCTYFQSGHTFSKTSKRKICPWYYSRGLIHYNFLILFLPAEVSLSFVDKCYSILSNHQPNRLWSNVSPVCASFVPASLFWKKLKLSFSVNKVTGTLWTQAIYSHASCSGIRVLDSTVPVI